jgi:hypothetical protein
MVAKSCMMFATERFFVKELNWVKKALFLNILKIKGTNLAIEATLNLVDVTVCLKIRSICLAYVEDRA